MLRLLKSVRNIQDTEFFTLFSKQEKAKENLFYIITSLSWTNQVKYPPTDCSTFIQLQWKHFPAIVFARWSRNQFGNACHTTPQCNARINN
jgi:hypothetical protein